MSRHHAPLHIASHVPPSRRNQTNNRRHAQAPNVLTPISLPEPTVYIQNTNITCWAACFRCVSRTWNTNYDTSDENLIRIFGHFLNSQGISARGVLVEGQMLGMYRRIYAGSNFSLIQLRHSLESGYVLMAYKKPVTNEGHVVVVYGVNQTELQVMNPDQVGLSTLPVSYMRHCREIMTLTPILRRQPIANPFGGLAEHTNRDHLYSGNNSDRFGGYLSH